MERRISIMWLLRSENITVSLLGELGASITTVTPWISKTIEFEFNTRFNMSYGAAEVKGVMNYLCTRPELHIIHCRSSDIAKGWDIMFDYIFTEEGLENRKYFLTKTIGKIFCQTPGKLNFYFLGMTKNYRRLKED